MELKRFQPPQFIEELVFQVPPEQVERYLDLDMEIFSTALSTVPGFLGGESWVSVDRPGEVTSLYFWASEKDFQSLDQAWLGGLKARMEEAMGAENLRFVRAGHAENRRCRVREYR